MALRLRTTVVISFSMLSLPLIGFIMVLMVLWAQAEDQVARDQTTTDARLLVRSLETMIEESQRVLDALADDTSLRWDQEKVVAARLATFANRFPFSRGVVAFRPNGWQWGLSESGQAPVSVSDRQWFRQALDQRTFVIGEFIISRVSGIPVIPMARVVERKGTIVAVVGISIDLAWFYQQIEAQERLAGTTITFVDDHGTVLIRYPQPERYVGKTFTSSGLVEVAAHGRAGVAILQGLDGVNRLYSVEPLHLTNRFFGSLTVGIPVAVVHAGTEGAQRVAWLVLGLVLLILVCILVFGIRHLVLRPLSLLSTHTEALSKGEFSTRVVGAHLPRELATLADSVNTMAAALRERDEELGRYRSSLEQMVDARTRELRESQQELQRSNQELQHFAYIASHDLQEPLRMVASFTQLLERKYQGSLDNQAREYIRFAVDGATRMQQLINDLLEYSRVETQVKALVPTESGKVASLAIQNLSELIKERKAEIVMGEMATIRGEASQLTQVFQNLIANGIKFNRSSPPQVSIRSFDRGEFIEFAVEDNGIGIDPQFADRIFVIFQRLNSRGEFGGTGIGLAVCKRIVEKHGGSIWFEPRNPGGSRFLFTIPKVK